MRRPASLLVLAIVVAAAGVFTLGPARAENASLEVHDNYFSPQRVAIDPGDTVTWTVFEAGHSVTADDGSFDFPGDGFFVGGEQVSFTFDRPGVYLYHCKIHGAANAYPQGMTGAIYVGTSFEPTGEVREVPAEFPTINDALRGIPPGSTVSIASGTYYEDLEVAAKGVTVAGEGDVVLDGQGAKPVGVAVKAADVTLEGLTVRGFTSTAVELHTNAPRFALRDLTTEGGDWGISVMQVNGGGIRDVRVRDARTGGVAFRDCTPCGVIVENVKVERSTAGIYTDQASGLVFRDLDLVDNPTGFSIANSQAVDVIGSTVKGGTTSIKVQTWSYANRDIRVEDNEVTGYADAGLWWDLIGLRICFSGNTDPALPDGPRSTPPLLQTLFPCV